MGKSAPSPPDFVGAANATAAGNVAAINAQTQANRPNVSTPFGFQSWNGNNMSQGFGGQLGSVNNNIQGQLASSWGSPVMSGDQARDQAISGAYNQAASRLDPRFAQQKQAMDAQLAGEGLDPSSQAARGQQQAFGQQQNDAYASAMNAAIGQGTQAGQATFNQNMAARQMPMQELQQMQGLIAPPGFNLASASKGPDFLGAAEQQSTANMNAWNAGQAQTGQDIGAGVGLLAAAATAYSDERIKHDIHRFEEEVIPGVPLAAFSYNHQPGVRHLGVIAQDLEKVAPEEVSEGPDGIKRVSASFAPFSFK